MEHKGGTILLNPALVESGTFSPSWGEVGNVVIRLMLTGDTAALQHMTTDVARAFAAAEALRQIQGKLPDDLTELACSVTAAELAKQGIQSKPTTKEK